MVNFCSVMNIYSQRIHFNISLKMFCISYSGTCSTFYKILHIERKELIMRRKEKFHQKTCQLKYQIFQVWQLCHLNQRLRKVRIRLCLVVTDSIYVQLLQAALMFRLLQQCICLVVTILKFSLLVLMFSQLQK